VPWHPATGHGSWGSPWAMRTTPSPCSSSTVGGGFFLRCSGLLGTAPGRGEEGGGENTDRSWRLHQLIIRCHITVSLLAARNTRGDLSRIYTAPYRLLPILGKVSKKQLLTDGRNSLLRLGQRWQNVIEGCSHVHSDAVRATLLTGGALRRLAVRHSRGPGEAHGASPGTAIRRGTRSEA
jgi:hypothetical protein